jgi:hypothetical protein
MKDTELNLKECQKETEVSHTLGGSDTLRFINLTEVVLGLVAYPWFGPETTRRTTGQHWSVSTGEPAQGAVMPHGTARAPHVWLCGQVTALPHVRWKNFEKLERVSGAVFHVSGPRDGWIFEKRWILGGFHPPVRGTLFFTHRSKDVLILLHMCPHTTTYVLRPVHVSSQNFVSKKKLIYKLFITNR